MAEKKTINTRLVLRNDMLSNWLSSTTGLLKGEAALAYLGEDKFQIRVGVDGTKTWNDLSAATGWSNLIFQPNNISGLFEFIDANETNTSYQIIGVDLSSGETGSSFQLQKKEKFGDAWKDVEGSRFNVPQFDPSVLNNRLSTLENQMSGEAADSVNYRIEQKGITLSNYVNQICADISTVVQNDYVKYSDVNGGKEALVNGNMVATLKDVIDLSGSVHVLGTITNKESESHKTDKEVIVETYPDAKRGAIVINTANGKEYLCMVAIGGTATVDDWCEIGDETLYETKTDAIAKLQSAKDYTDTKISALDASVTNDSAAKTIDTITEVDGVVQATFKDIEIQQSQVSGLVDDIGKLSNWIESVEDATLTSITINNATETLNDRQIVFDISCINCGDSTDI